MKYQRKKFRTKNKDIRPQYGYCKVLYIDKYNTLLHKTLWVKVKCKKCGKIVSKSLSRMKDAIKHGYPNTCGCVVSKSDRDDAVGNRHRLYSIWNNMISRVECENSPQYKYYGERGITICKEWRNNYLSFKEWALNHGYNDKLTIDRIDVNGNYEPNNCRWITQKQQLRSMRSNKMYTINGVTKCLQDWCEYYDINMNTVNKRLRLNWDIEKALTKPVKKNNHYSQYTYELKDVSPILLQNLKGVDAIYIFNALKYVWRYPFKNGSTDLKKALEYIQFLKEVLKNED